MSILFPASLDSFANPTGTDLLDNANNALDHDVQHSNANDAIEALEAKVGIDNSADVDSFDYKLSNVASGDKAISDGATGQSVEELELINPTITLGGDATGDIFYRDSGGNIARLPIGTAGQILQASSGGLPEWIANPAASNASTTVKGVVEEATLAETLARTATGGTSARLFVNPSTLTTVQTYDYVASSAGTDSYAITVTPAPTAYVTGQKFTFKADVANTGAATLDVNSLGAKTIKKNVSNDLATNDIIANAIVEVIYDGTNFQMQSVLSTTGNGAYAADYTAGSSAIQNSTQTHTITHGLGTIPRLINVVTQNVSTVGGGGASVSHGNATVDASGTILTQQVVTGYWLNGSTTRFDATAITQAHGNGAQVVGTLQNVTSTTFEISWASTTNVNGTPNYVWEVFA